MLLFGGYTNKNTGIIFKKNEQQRLSCGFQFFWCRIRGKKCRTLKCEADIHSFFLSCRCIHNGSTGSVHAASHGGHARGVGLVPEGAAEAVVVRGGGGGGRPREAIGGLQEAPALVRADEGAGGGLGARTPLNR
jgi:hypothetical protein